jgi:hypothetical protein
MPLELANPDWPNFTWDRTKIANAEEQFLLGSGVVIGSVKHLEGAEHKQLLVELMSIEAVTTSKIEGEVLNRDSVQSSIQRWTGLLNRVYFNDVGSRCCKNLLRPDTVKVAIIYRISDEAKVHGKISVPLPGSSVSPPAPEKYRFPREEYFPGKSKTGTEWSGCVERSPLSVITA